MSHNIKTPLTSISRAVGNILQLKYDQLIKSLFANNEQGFFYDPNDLSTMFQDSAGTIPVTGVGQPVGLMLDKSKGLVVGVERLTNGDFSAGSAGWTVVGNDATHIITFANGTMRYQSDTATPVLAVQQFNTLTVGKWYEVTITISNYVSGAIKSDGLGGLIFPSSTGTYKLRAIATSTTFNLLRQMPNVDITIDSVSIKELAGNHAFQTTSASRPILRQTPILGNELLVNGDFATNDFTGWTHPDSAPSVTTVANQQVTMTAGAGSTLARLRQSLSVTAGEYVVSLDVKSITGTLQVHASMGNTATGDATYGVITCDRLGKYEQKITVAAGTLGLAFTTSSINGGSIVIDDISVKRVTSYRTDQNYLAFDGSDDFLQTSNIDFTATDKVSLFAGVRKLSDAAPGMLYELSTNSFSADGSFYLATPVTTSQPGTDGFNLRGTTAISKTHIAISPASVMYTTSGDIGNKAIVFRTNGITRGSGLVNVGTGKLGNYPLYIGRRAGTSLPFNGHIYGLIGIGKLVSDSETLAIEKELAKRIGVTL
jgi:hypothetical protein